jgi:hypothetical protein
MALDRLLSWQLTSSGEGFVVRVISSSEVSLFNCKLHVAAPGRGRLCCSLWCYGRVGSPDGGAAGTGQYGLDNGGGAAAGTGRG